MRLKISKKFKELNSELPKETQLKVLKILELIKASNTIKNINSRALVGFPFVHKIEIDNYSLCFFISKDEVEILGIVESGKELPLII